MWYTKKNSLAQKPLNMRTCRTSKGLDVFFINIRLKRRQDAPEIRGDNLSDHIPHKPNMAATSCHPGSQHVTIVINMASFLLDDDKRIVPKMVKLANQAIKNGAWISGYSYDWKKGADGLPDFPHEQSLLPQSNLSKNNINVSHEKNLLLSIESWSVNGDPSYFNPHMTG